MGREEKGNSRRRLLFPAVQINNTPHKRGRVMAGHGREDVGNGKVGHSRRHAGHGRWEEERETHKGCGTHRCSGY